MPGIVLTVSDLLTGSWRHEYLLLRRMECGNVRELVLTMSFVNGWAGTWVQASCSCLNLPFTLTLLCPEGLISTCPSEDWFGERLKRRRWISLTDKLSQILSLIPQTLGHLQCLDSHSFSPLWGQGPSHKYCGWRSLLLDTLPCARSCFLVNSPCVGARHGSHWTGCLLCPLPLTLPRSALRLRDKFPHSDFLIHTNLV